MINSIYDIGYNLLLLLLGDSGQTARGILVAEYCGYLTVGVTLYLLIKVAISLTLYPFKKFKEQ